jgi:transposase
MRKIEDCIRLKSDCGLLHAQIGRALGLSKGVVTKYRQRAGQAGLNWETAALLDEGAIAARLSPARAPLPSQRVVPDWAVIHRELRRKGVTLQLLWEEYVDAHRGAATYCLKRSMRQTHRAGEKLFIDYAGQTVPVIDRATGEIRPAHIFVAVLGASNYTFACASADRSAMRRASVGWHRTAPITTAPRSRRPGLTIPRIRPRSKSVCNSSSAGFWHVCGTAAASR